MPEVQEWRVGVKSKPRSERVLGFDVARSLALLGMFVVHFGLVMASDRSHPSWAVAILDLLDGRAAATFVVLAGVGLSLRASRSRANDPLAASRAKGVVARRGLFLLVVGFANLPDLAGRHPPRLRGVAARGRTDARRLGAHAPGGGAWIRRGLRGFARQLRLRQELGMGGADVPSSLDAWRGRPQPLL